MSPNPDFIADLFDCAISDIGWTRSASVIAAALGVDQVAIVVNRNSSMPDISVTADILEFMGSYDVHYRELDPWALRRRTLKPRGAVLANELFAEEKLIRTEFYNDYARHVGMFRPMTIDMLSPAGHQVEVGAEQPFSSRLFNDQDKIRFDALAPYIARAVDMRQALKAEKIKQGFGANLIEAWAHPAIVCDRNGWILIANSGAEDLASIGFLSMRSKPLKLPLASPALAAQTQKMIANAAGGGPGGSFHVRAEDTGRLFLILISPVSTQLDIGEGHALVTISASHIRHFSVDAIRSLFSLSVAQAELAVALYEGLSLDAYALKRQVKISTVRTQLLQLFEKMGVNNQKDVVSILGRIPPVKG